MKIIESYLKKNPCYTLNQKIAVKGLMLHSVGCSQPRASVFINSWNKASFDRACVHAFIDGNDGNTYQTLPWNHRGWHAGGAANDTHIGVEMCEPECITYTSGSTFTCSDLKKAQTIAKRTYESAVELFAQLCTKYKLNPLSKGVIISHKEGCALGVATDHGDPEHLWKGLKMGYTMDGFRKDVKAAMQPKKAEEPKKESTSSSKKYYVFAGAYKVKANADAQLNKVKKAGFKASLVKDGELYKVQVSSHSKKSDADARVKKLDSKGFDAYILTTTGKAVEPSKTIKVGCTVKLKKGAKTFDGGSLASFVYDWKMQVVEIINERVVIAHNGSIIAAVRKSDLTLV